MPYLSALHRKITFFSAGDDVEETSLFAVHKPLINLRNSAQSIMGATDIF
jgi:hypothetical protein